MLFPRRKFRKLFGFDPGEFPDPVEYRFVGLVLQELQEELSGKQANTRQITSELMEEIDLPHARILRDEYKAAQKLELAADKRLEESCELTVRFGFGEAVKAIPRYSYLALI